MKTRLLPLRLLPGADLRGELETAIAEPGASSVFVVSGIGSLTHARLRFAASKQERSLSGPFEILTLAGTVTPDGAHIHIALADEAGRVLGGHLCYGNQIRTTAEILLAPVADWSLSREFDEKTGYMELSVKPGSE